MFIQNQNFGSPEQLQYNFQINGYVYPPHIHQFSELGYVISGELEVIINGRAMTAREGEFILIQPLHIHEYNSPSGCSAFICAFANSLFPELSTSDGKNIFRCSRGVEDYFITTIVNGELSGHPMPRESIESDAAHTESCFVDLSSPQMLMRIKSCFYAVFSEYELQNVSSDDKKRGDPMPDLLIWLSEHYTEPLKLADAAAYLGYSSNYLSHIIKRTSGMSFCEILGCLRIDCALKLLAKPHGRIIDLALDCGFQNERSFHRTFRRVTGKSPSEYLNGNI